MRLAANLYALVETLLRLKPASAKGTYMKNVCVSSTMGPGADLDTAQLQDNAKVHKNSFIDLTGRLAKDSWCSCIMRHGFMMRQPRRDRAVCLQHPRKS